MKTRTAFFFGTLAGLIFSLAAVVVFLIGLNKGVAVGLALCQAPTAGASNETTW